MSDVWRDQLLEQLEWHWDHQLRPRLDGLGDEEYRWEPARDAWSVRPAGECRSAAPIGTGAFQRDDAPDDPEPPPVTTIAWRLAHITVDVLAMRNQAFFAGPPAHYESWPYAGTAAEALAQLDAEYSRWRDGLAALSDEQLLEPIGERQPHVADDPAAMMVLHIHREVIHHGAEVLLLRDLFRSR